MSGDRVLAAITGLIAVCALSAAAIGAEALNLMSRDFALDKAAMERLLSDPPPALWCEREDGL
jgi:hypothetical protein